jgi:hypothetical protein
MQPESSREMLALMLSQSSLREKRVRNDAVIIDDAGKPFKTAMIDAGPWQFAGTSRMGKVVR